MSSLRVAIALGLVACMPVPAASAAFPGRNGRLAVVVEQGETARVVTARADGTRVRRIATGGSAHWSRDGRHLLVPEACPSSCLDDGGPHALRVVDVEDGSARRVRLRERPGTWQPQAPAWTPAGRFVFGRQAIGEAAGTVIVVADRRGREGVLSLPVASFSATARAAPSGGAIAVAVSSPDSRLVVVPAGGAPPRVLLDCAPAFERQQCTGLTRLDWSPDATRIAFESSPPGGASMIRVIDVVSGAITEVRPGTAPFWSPDGKLLGSVSPQGQIELGPPAPGPTRTLPLRDVVAADWQPLSRR